LLTSFSFCWLSITFLSFSILFDRILVIFDSLFILSLDESRFEYRCELFIEGAQSDNLFVEYEVDRPSFEEMGYTRPRHPQPKEDLSLVTSREDLILPGEDLILPKEDLIPHISPLL